LNINCRLVAKLLEVRKRVI